MSSPSGPPSPVASDVGARNEVAWDMTISREELARILPGAVGEMPRADASDAFSGGDGNRGWRVVLEELPALRLGAIVLPRRHVRLQLWGYGITESEGFLRRWELHFRRGGG